MGGPIMDEPKDMPELIKDDEQDEEDLWLSVIRRSGPCCLASRAAVLSAGSSAATHGCSHLALSEHWNHLADFFPRSCVVRVLQETIVFSSRRAQLAGQLAVQVAAMLGLAGQLVAQLGGDELGDRNVKTLSSSLRPRYVPLFFR